MTALSRIARQDHRWSSDLPERLQDAVLHYDFASAEEFGSLSDLSNATELEFVKSHGESAVIENDHWRAPVTIYVVLNYGEKGDLESMTDSYPGAVVFDVGVDGRITISRIEPDVTSFYGEEADIG
jgi:hypothetical protein